MFLLVRPIIYGFFNASLAVILKIPIGIQNACAFSLSKHNKNHKDTQRCRSYIWSTHTWGVHYLKAQIYRLSTSVRTWLICFAKPGFCWSGSFVTEILQTKRSPRGSCRWMNNRGKYPQNPASKELLEMKVAKLSKLVYTNVCKLWNLFIPTRPATEPLRRKKRKKKIRF